MPPVYGSAPATSASVSAPQSARTPPMTHTIASGSGPGSLSAIEAGDLKMPEPMVVPMTTATALQRPRRLGRFDGGFVDIGPMVGLITTRDQGTGYKGPGPRAQGLGPRDGLMTPRARCARGVMGW